MGHLVLADRSVLPSLSEEGRVVAVAGGVIVVGVLIAIKAGMFTTVVIYSLLTL